MCPGAVDDQCAALEQTDRLLVGGLVLGHQGPRIGLDAKTPRLPARLRAFLEGREGRGGDLGLATPHGRLDQLGQGKARRADGAVLDRFLRRLQRGRVVGQAVAEHGRRPLHAEAHPLLHRREQFDGILAPPAQRRQVESWIDQRRRAGGVGDRLLLGDQLRRGTEVARVHGHGGLHGQSDGQRVEGARFSAGRDGTGGDAAHGLDVPQLIGHHEAQ